MVYKPQIARYKIEYDWPWYVVSYKDDCTNYWHPIGWSSLYLMAKHIMKKHIKAEKEKEQETFYLFTKDGELINE